MEVLEKNEALFKVDEIFKYKDLIDREDREVIKAIINNNDENSTTFYNSFLELVVKEADHKLNKKEFAEHRDNLVTEMKKHLGEN